ncbi:hypothetical protein ISCGN_012955 [Ixodes scapularis]
MRPFSAASGVDAMTESLSSSPGTSRQPGSARQRCMPAGRGEQRGGLRRRSGRGPLAESTRALVCVLSERTDEARTFSKDYCTHIVFSIRHYGHARLDVLPADYLSGLKSPGALVLVAVHERALAGPLDGLVRSTARQLKSGQLDGLALLHASPSTALVLKAFRSTYLAEDLCLLASIRLSDDQTSSASGGKLLRELSAHLDLVVIDTHHGGGEGPCRAVAAASLNRPLSGCRPQVAVRTALSWMQEAGASLRAAACFSVDMRVFRYHTYGPGVLDGPCHSEEQLRYERVCRQAAWSFARDDYSVTQVGRDDEGALLSFETPDTLRDKVLSASRDRPSVCVAVFNYDYEDFGGHCHDKPYARLRALRAALGRLAPHRGGAQAQRRSLPRRCSPGRRRWALCVRTCVTASRWLVPVSPFSLRRGREKSAPQVCH